MKRIYIWVVILIGLQCAMWSMSQKEPKILEGLVTFKETEGTVIAMIQVQPQNWEYHLLGISFMHEYWTGVDVFDKGVAWFEEENIVVVEIKKIDLKRNDVYTAMFLINNTYYTR